MLNDWPPSPDTSELGYFHSVRFADSGNNYFCRKALKLQRSAMFCGNQKISLLRSFKLVGARIL
jgi:hypothetical protein